MNNLEMQLNVQESTLPSAVRWAVKALLVHPHISNLSLQRCENNTHFRVKFTVRTHLPGHWKGTSPSGVRRDETVFMDFPPDYPLTAPKVFLRADFDRSHPHLQPGSSDSLPEPCLLDGVPREFIQARGGLINYVDQLVKWLERASEAKLIDPEQGWEPIRRDVITDIVWADSASLKDRVTDRGGCDCYVAMWETPDITESTAFTCLIDQSRNKDPGTWIFKLQTRWTKKQHAVGDTFALYAWPGSNYHGKLHVDGKYRPETVSTVQEMFERAEQFGCHIDLKRTVHKLRQLLQRSQANRAVPIIIILAARRPCKLINSDSSLEFSPYLTLVKSSKDLMEASQTPVRPMGHRDTVSAELLRHTSGTKVSPNATWSLVGCGSVGSKLALHMARQGTPPITVVDHDVLQPHNYARHTALPIMAGPYQFLGGKKSTSISANIESLSQETVDTPEDIVDLLSTGNVDNLCRSKNELLVNSTASSVVREALASIPWNNEYDRPRMFEACLFGAGRFGYMSLEGQNGNPNTGDLISEYYRCLLDKPEMSSAVHGSEADHIHIGQGCGSHSFVMPDAQISQFVAPFSIQLSHILSRPEKHSSGAIYFLERGVDGLSMTSSNVDIDPVKVIDGEHINAPLTRLSNRVHIEIERQIKARPGVETGGVIMGRYSAIGNVFYAVDLVPAPPDSQHTPNLFVLGTEGLREAIDTYVTTAGGSLYPLGTWHNHLQVSEPSDIDRNTAVSMAEEKLIPTLMLIHTPNGYLVVSPLPKKLVDGEVSDA